MTKRIVYLDEAADILGLSKDALRKRVKRGSIKATKDEAGRWQVIIEDSDQDGDHRRDQAEKDVIYKLLQEQIEQLKGERDFYKHLLISREQRILQLEAGKKERRLPSWWPFGRKEKEI